MKKSKITPSLQDALDEARENGGVVSALFSFPSLASMRESAEANRLAREAFDAACAETGETGEINVIALANVFCVEGPAALIEAIAKSPSVAQAKLNGTVRAF
jgi:hypothetical protein